MGGNLAAKVATHGTAARSNAETLSDTDSDDRQASFVDYVSTSCKPGAGRQTSSGLGGMDGRAATAGRTSCLSVTNRITPDKIIKAFLSCGEIKPATTLMSPRSPSVSASNRPPLYCATSTGTTPINAEQETGWRRRCSGSSRTLAPETRPPPGS